MSLHSIAAADSDDHAVALANDCPFGLGSAVWSRNTARARSVGERIEVQRSRSGNDLR